MRNTNLGSLIEVIRVVSSEVETYFGALSAGQLNWKPAVDQWSIGQCLDHIITLNQTYFPLFNKIIRGEYRPSLWQRLPILPNIFGAMIIKAVQPESKKKYKTFPVFEPVSGVVYDNIVEVFLTHQEELSNFITQFDQPEYRRIVISSPASHWITYRLSDCFEFLAVHEKRHLKQAIGIMNSEKFP
jgi:hypothetical protein